MKVRSLRCAAKLLWAIAVTPRVAAWATDNAQPHMSAIDEVLIALAHNGTLVNTNRIRADLISKGVEFRSNTDSEVACQVIGYYTRETHHLTEGHQNCHGDD